MKPGVFTQMYVQIVFAVKYKKASLHSSIQEQVYKYISGILTEQGHKSIIVNGVDDHIHIFFGLNPRKSISDIVHDIKRSSSLFINTNKLCPSKFSWQDGYGSFTYSRSHIKNVYNYILNQHDHHKKESFKTEYLKYLNKFEIDYKEQYLFDFWGEAN